MLSFLMSRKRNDPPTQVPIEEEVPLPDFSIPLVSEHVAALVLESMMDYKLAVRKYCAVNGIPFEFDIKAKGGFARTMYEEIMKNEHVQREVQRSLKARGSTKTRRPSS